MNEKEIALEWLAIEHAAILYEIILDITNNEHLAYCMAEVAFKTFKQSHCDDKEDWL